MKTLFIDSSRKSLSIAIASENKLLFISNVESYSRHSNFLMNEIVNILKKSNITIYDIDNIVVLNGPGSFTGVRVGVTIAKTIAWTLSKKLYQLSNLEALNIHGEKTEVNVSVIYDKKDSSYVEIHSNNLDIKDYMKIDDTRLNFKNKSILIVTYGENEFVNDLKEKLLENNNVSVKIVKEYDYLKVIDYAISKENINPHLAEPIYLKKIDAEKKKNDTKL